MTENKSIYITVPESGNHIDDFKRFMAATTESLNRDAKFHPDHYRVLGGEKLEPEIIKAMKEKAPEFRFDPTKIEGTKKQHFPDIIANNYFGVEVKSTQSNHWKSTGSSIFENLREKDVKKIFLMFGKLPRNADVAFCCRPYEECLYSISNTHMPRYQIDMETQKGETIFDKIGMGYDEFRLYKHKGRILKPYFQETMKTTPWFFDDAGSVDAVEEDQTIPELLRQPQNGVRFWGDIDDKQTLRYLTASMYQLFPEILSSSNKKKYKKASLWLCSRHSIINPSFRDIFSSGGKGDIYVNGFLQWKDVPKTICNLTKYMGDIHNSFMNKTSPYDEIIDNSDYYKDGYDLWELWKSKADECIKTNKGLKLSVDFLSILTFRKSQDIKRNGKVIRTNYYLTSPGIEM